MSLDLIWMDSWQSPRRAIRIAQTPEAEFVWEVEFHKGFWSIDRQNYRRRSSWYKALSAYCRTFLERIAAAQETRNYRGGSEAGLVMAQAAVLRQQSMLAELAGDLPSSRAYAEEALEAAIRSNLAHAMYGAYTHLGRTEYRIGQALCHDKGNPPEACRAYERAAVCHQRALMYATPSWPISAIDTIHDLAGVWAECAGTYVAALNLYDWLYHLKPDSLGPIIEKYECMLCWLRPEVLKKARKRRLTEPFQAAESAAANWALRRKERAYADAEIGLSLAEREGNAKLVTLFTHFLSTRRNPVEAE